jgi:broad specificity phosphatase PhoE
VSFPGVSFPGNSGGESASSVAPGAAFYGEGSVDLIRRLCESGVGRVALLVRHSVREFNRNVHDLVNPLTDEGRHHCRLFGVALPKDLAVRGYASPPERCVETARIVIDAHTAGGGRQSGATRPVESLGVFYALDQIKMWKTLQSSSGLSGFITRWAAGDVPRDAMIPADDAARLIARSSLERLRSGGEQRHLDFCVTHDMTILLLRDRLLGRPAATHSVNFLEALALYESAGAVWLQAADNQAVNISDALV